MFEELGFIPKKVLDVTIPTLALEYMTTLGISSKPVSEDSPMNHMMNARYKDTGRLVFKTRVFSTTCNRCRLRGKTECPHYVEMPWSSQDQSAKIRAIMGEGANFRREILNEDAESNIVKAFNVDSVDAFANSSFEIPASTRISHVFVAVDPAAGGSASKFAIVSHVTVPRHEAESQHTGVSEDVVVHPPPNLPVPRPLAPIRTLPSCLVLLPVLEIARLAKSNTQLLLAAVWKRVSAVVVGHGVHAGVGGPFVARAAD